MDQDYLLRCLRACGDAEVDYLLAHGGRHTQTAVWLQSEKRLQRIAQLPEAVRRRFIADALHRGRDAADQLTAAIFDRYSDELGDAFADPTIDQLRAATQRLTESVPVGLLRVALVTVVVTDQRAAPHAAALLAAGDPIPPLPEPTAEPHPDPRPTDGAAKDPADDPEAGTQQQNNDAEPGRDDEGPDSPPADPTQDAVSTLAAADHSVLDRIIIAECIAAAASASSALSPVDLGAAITELLQLDPLRARSWYHVGFAQELGVVPADLGDESAAALNEERRRWLLVGRLSARLRLDPHALRRIPEAELGDLVAIAADALLGLHLARPIVRALLERDPRSAAVVLRERPPMQPFRDAAAVRDEFELIDIGLAHTSDRLAQGHAKLALVLVDALNERQRVLADELVGELTDEPATMARLIEARARTGLLRARALRRGDRFGDAMAVLDELDARAEGSPSVPAGIAVTARTQAALSLERALAAARLAKLSNVKPGRDAAERDRIIARLTPAEPHIRQVLEVDPHQPDGAYLAGVLADARGDTAAATRLLEIAAGGAGDTDWSPGFQSRVLRAWALSALADPDTGADGPAVGALMRASERGRFLTRDEVDRVLSALLILGSPHLAGFVASLRIYPTNRVLPAERLAEVAIEAPHTASSVAALHRHVPQADRLELLHLCAAAAAQRGDDELLADILDAIDATLREGGRNHRVWRDWAQLLQADQELRQALGPEPVIDWMVRCAENVDDRELAARIALDAFAELPRQPEQAVLAGELAELVARGHGALAADGLREEIDIMFMPRAVRDRSLPTGRTAVPVRQARVLFIGGDERQAKLHRLVEAELATRRDLHVEITWQHPGWSPNWVPEADRAARNMDSADILVLMPMVRTNFGRRIRKVAGEKHLRWHACTGVGAHSIAKAIAEAAEFSASRHEPVE